MAAPTVSKRLPIPVFITSQTGDAAMNDTADSAKVTLYNSSGVEITSLGGGGAAAVTQDVLMTAVTTNTTSSAVAGKTGNKTFWAEVVGTGAVSVTVTIYGARTNAAADGVELAVLSPTGTTKGIDVAAGSTAAYPYYYAVTTSISGTGATVQVEVLY